MTNKKKAKDDKPVDDEKVEEPKADEPVADDKPVADSKPAGADQYGRQLHDVTCSSCGNKAQVPFKPSGDRPVYCRDCYMKQRQERGGGMNRGPRR